MKTPAAVIRLIVAALALTLAACAQPRSFTPLTISEPVVREYRLGSADKLRVNVFGEPSLSGEFIVGPDGAIALPLIGNVKAAGLTTREIGANITAGLADGYLREPRVSVDVLTYRPYYILGEVNRPGEYPYSAGLTVLNAVATAQGFTYRANQRRVYIKNADSVQETLYPLTSATPVQPGDTVRIGERFF